MDAVGPPVPTDLELSCTLVPDIAERAKGKGEKKLGWVGFCRANLDTYMYRTTIFLIPRKFNCCHVCHWNLIFSISSCKKNSYSHTKTL